MDNSKFFLLGFPLFVADTYRQQEADDRVLSFKSFFFSFPFFLEHLKGQNSSVLDRMLSQQ